MRDNNLNVCKFNHVMTLNIKSNKVSNVLILVNTSNLLIINQKQYVYIKMNVDSHSISMKTSLLVYAFNLVCIQIIFTNCLDKTIVL